MIHLRRPTPSQAKDNKAFRTGDRRRPRLNRIATPPQLHITRSPLRLTFSADLVISSLSPSPSSPLPHWLRPVAMSLVSPPLQAGAQTLLGRATRHAAHTPGGLKSMDFLSPQCGSTRARARAVTVAPHRTVAPSHHRTATPAAIGAQTVLGRATRHN